MPRRAFRRPRRRALRRSSTTPSRSSVGSISAEHGLGRSKAAAAAAYKSDVEVELMRAVKDALDPAGLMNPGAVLPLPPVLLG